MTLDLESIVLEWGAHPPDGGVCVMELASRIAGEPHTDHPECVSPAIAAFLRTWNDALDDEERQRLKPWAARVIGTRTSPADEERRSWLATDWLVRTFAPAWLDLAGLGEHAAALRQLPELSSDELATQAQGVISAAGIAAGIAARNAARNAAGIAARSAAYSAAERAAYSAAGRAAYRAAWSAAESAAWSAAGRAAYSAAWSAAESAARIAAWNAAGRAAWRAAGRAAWSATWSAARSAAGQALAPTVAALQDSAEELLGRMVAVGLTTTEGSA